MKKSKSDNKEDRLSDLPDCVLIHLMSFMLTKDAVRTCIFSRRWKDLWKRVPSLILHSSYSRVLQITAFNNFVLKFLSLRDNSVPLRYLDFHHIGRVPPQLFERILEYAVSHSVEQIKLGANCDPDLPLPLCLFSCQTLTSLDLSIERCPVILLPRSLNLTELTTLRLYRVYLRNSSPFSSCIKLKTLVIDHCRMWNLSMLRISNAALVKLSILASPFISDNPKLMLSTPNLRYFFYSGIPSRKISADTLSHLREVNIDVQERPASHSHHSRYLQSAGILISWLQVLANVRSLTLCSNALEDLSTIPDLSNTKAPCFSNLKSLIVKVKNHLVPEGVVDYLIRNVPSADINFINY